MDKLVGGETQTRVHKPSINLRYTFLFTCSFAALYVLNCLVSMVDYWKGKYPDGSYAFALFAMHMGGMLGYISPTYLMRCFSPATLMYFCNPLSFVGSALVLVFGDFIPLQDQLTTKLLGSAAAFLVGFSGSVLQTVSTAYGFRFGSKEIAYLNMGISVSGIFTVLIQMANIQYTSDDLSTQVMSYELFQLVGVVVIFLITWAYFKDVPLDEFLHKPYTPEIDDQKTKDDIQKAVLQRLTDHTSKNRATVEQSQPSMWSTFKLIYAYWFSLFLSYTITMSLAPQILFEIGLGWDNPQANQLILLTYSVMDTVGRYLFAFWVLESPSINLTMSLLRILLIATSISVLIPEGFQEQKDNWILTLSITALDGLSKGYLNCSLFHLASECTKGKHSVNSAFLMVLAIMGGLTYGSLINVLAIS